VSVPHPLPDTKMTPRRAKGNDQLGTRALRARLNLERDLLSASIRRGLEREGDAGPR
jgi:hypothetical protein